MMQLAKIKTQGGRVAILDGAMRWHCGDDVTARYLNDLTKDALSEYSPSHGDKAAHVVAFIRDMIQPAEAEIFPREDEDDEAGRVY
jgi:hypothetical protein